MFVLNQLFGSMVVAPDFDAQFQVAVRYVTLGMSVYVYDILEVANHFENFYG